MDDNLRKRLAALRATAEGRGTTEAEAMAAAEKMAQIMREHGLTDYDVEFDEAQAPLKTRRPTARTGLLSVIAICTNCVGTLQSDWTPCVIYTGRTPGPELAVYLTAVCERAIDRAVAEFQKSAEYKRRRTLSTRRKATEDFTIGMVNRLGGRLLDMFNDSRDEAGRSQAELVRDTRMPTTSPAKLRDQKVRFGDAAWAGQSAGQRVQLAPGVNGGKPVRQIGKG
mgnify:CR=1 FL=1